MKLGIIGMGSIGQRHVRCLKDLGYKDIVALRTGKGHWKKLPADLSYIKELHDADEFYSQGLDGVIISNPTSLHVPAMKQALKEGVAVFVEKPISKDLKQLRNIKGLNTTRVMVGYNLRYSRIVKAMKSFISSGKLGRIYKADLYCGQYLPSWHKDADYRKEYYSKRSLGGGALRTLSHEIDLAGYLLGDTIELIAKVQKISDLEIDVDDSVYMALSMKKGVIGFIELDLLNTKPSRNGTIFGTKGILSYSFNPGAVMFVDRSGKKKYLLQEKQSSLDGSYHDQMKDFVGLIKKRKNKIFCNFQDGLKVMRIIDAAELSSSSKRWQKVGR
jgi:predicted dehydrogenase